MKYRPEIDGLRAIAVIGVLIYHAENSWLPGGYLGVDIFFVISGYLITGIVYAECMNSEFTLRAFYEKRIRRIIPLLYSVVLCSIIVASVVMTNEQLRDFSKSVGFVTLFSSNLLFWRESGYFDQISEFKPLLHTWSLGVEEQFYVLYPLLLVFLAKKFKEKKVVLLIGLLAFGSLVFAEILSRANPDANFYLPFGRAWELLCGAMCYFGYTNYRKKIIPSVGNTLGAFALTAIATSFILFDSTTPNPSLVTLIPVLGAFILILLPCDSFVTKYILSARGFVFVGLLSYSLYLWHQPILSFYRIYSDSPPNITNIFILITITVCVAYFTHYGVENYFRNRINVSNIKLSILLTILSAFFIVYSIVGYKSNGFREIYIPGFTNTSSIVPDFRNERLSRQLYLDDNLNYSAFVGLGKKVLVVGDSHAQDLYISLSSIDLSNQLQLRYLNLTIPCVEKLVPNSETYDISKAAPECDSMLKNVLNHQNIHDADTVIISLRWTLKSVLAIPSLVSRIQNSNKGIVLVGRTAEFWSPTNFYSRYLNDSSVQSDSIVTHRFSETRNKSIDEINRKIESYSILNNIKYFDKAAVVCGSSMSQCDYRTEYSKPVFFDYGHWTLAGAQHFSRKINLNNMFLFNE